MSCAPHHISSETSHHLFDFSLRTRQNEWKKAEEERIASLPDPTVPQGHSVMTEEERTKTLGLLQKCKCESGWMLIKNPESSDYERCQTENLHFVQAKYRQR